MSKELSFAYLAQGSAANLSRYRFPPGRDVVLLTYDQPIERDDALCIFDDACTWSQGRNRLARRLCDHGPLADYVIFCDDDVEFLSVDFSLYEERLAASRPLLGVPTMPKGAESPTFRADLDIQRVLALDEQIVALHRDAFAMAGVVPLVDEFDHVSWYVAPLVFEYLVLSRAAPFCHQYNDIVVSNEGHTWQTGGTLYHRGDLDACLAVWRNLVRAMTAGFDPSIVEQFDESRDANLAMRMRRVADTRPWPGAAPPS